MERKPRILTVSTFFFFLLALPITDVFCTESRFYIGAGLGRSSIDLDELGGAKAVLLGPGDTIDSFTKRNEDDDDVGWKVYGGFRFHRHFALEASYIDFGDFSVDTSGTATVSGLQTTFATNFDAEVKGIGVAALAIWPAIAERLSLFGKVGAFRWDADSDLRGSFSVGALSGSLSDSDDDSGTEFMFGLGAEYYFFDKFAVRLEWERFNDVGDERTVRFEDDVDLVSASLQYRF